MGPRYSRAERNRQRDRQNAVNSLTNTYNHINSRATVYRKKSNNVHADYIHLVKIINPDPLPIVSPSDAKGPVVRSRNQTNRGRGGGGGGGGGGGHQMSNEAIMREFVKVRTKLLELLKDIPDKSNTLDELIDTKDMRERDKARLTYLEKVLAQAISDLKNYGDLQASTSNLFTTTVTQLEGKIVKREQLNYNNYERRNEVMDRATKKLGSSYSNDYSNVRYQDQHTQFFVSLNSIFWYLYYLLILVIGYQLQYIQNNMTLQRKITWITVLVIYPFLYYAYDFMVV